MTKLVVSYQARVMDSTARNFKDWTLLDVLTGEFSIPADDETVELANSIIAQNNFFSTEREKDFLTRLTMVADEMVKAIYSAKGYERVFSGITWDTIKLEVQE